MKRTTSCTTILVTILLVSCAKQQYLDPTYGYYLEFPSGMLLTPTEDGLIGQHPNNDSQLLFFVRETDASSLDEYLETLDPDMMSVAKRTEAEMDGAEAVNLIYSFNLAADDDGRAPMAAGSGNADFDISQYISVHEGKAYHAECFSSPHNFEVYCFTHFDLLMKTFRFQAPSDG